MKPTTWGAYLIKRFCRVRQQRELVGATQQRSIRANRSSPYLCQGPDSKWENLDQSSLFIFSIFSSLFGFRMWPTYILYQYISSFRRSPSYHIVFSPVFSVFGSEIWHFQMCGNEGTWQKNLEWYPQHNLIHPYLSSISQTSCRRKKPSRWKSIKTHTHTHTHPPTHTHTHTHTHTRSIIVLKAALSKRQPLKMILSLIQMFHVLIINCRWVFLD